MLVSGHALDSSRVIALHQLVVETLEHNPDIEAARHRFESAMAVIPQVRTLPDPKILVGYTDIAPMKRPMFGPSQEIPFPGKLALQGEVANYEAQRVEQEYFATQLNIIAGLKKLYYELRLVHKSIEVVNKNKLLLSGFEKTAAAVIRYNESAIGGENSGITIEGRERYPINVRYLREFRDNPDKLGRVLVDAPSGAQVPLAQLASLQMISGPAMIRDENGVLFGYVYVDMAGRDVGGYVEDLKELVRDKVELPAGYTLSWSGQYEFMARVRERLNVFVPLTLAIIFVPYYFTFRSIVETLMVMLGVPLALVGDIWLMALLGYDLSIAVWVGLIALGGVAAETSAVMLAYLDEAVKRRCEAGRLNSLPDLLETVHDGAMERIRPVTMTGRANFVGLAPVMEATGAGADVMKTPGGTDDWRHRLGDAVDAAGDSSHLCNLALA